MDRACALVATAKVRQGMRHDTTPSPVMLPHTTMQTPGLILLTAPSLNLLCAPTCLGPSCVYVRVCVCVCDGRAMCSRYQPGQGVTCLTTTTRILTR